MRNLKARRENTEFIFPVNAGNLKIEAGLNKTLAVKSPDRQDVTLTDLHFHPYHELFIVKQGALTVFTEKKNYEFTGKSVIIPPFFRHRSLMTGEIYRLSFSFTEVKKPRVKGTGLEKALFGQDIESFCLDDDFISQAERLNGILCHPSIDKQELSAVLYLFFKKLFSFYGFKIENDFVPDNDDLTLIENYVFKNYDKDISLISLADYVKKSPKQTSRIIRARFHKTFPQLVKDKRMSVACILLKNTALPIAEIISKINVDNESYFYRLFKAEYGCTPTEYRQHNTVRKE